MYLSELSVQEKELFLELAYKLANADKDYASDEIRLFKMYKKEAGIDTINTSKSLDELIDAFAGKAITTKKIVYFQLLFMILADKKISDSEQAIIEKMVSAFKFTNKESEELYDVAVRIGEVFGRMDSAIRG